MKISIIIIWMLLGLTAESQSSRRYPDTAYLLHVLQTYHTDNIEFIKYTFFAKKNTTLSIKQMLLSLLKHEWTDKEVNKKVDNFFRENFDDVYFNRIRGKTYTSIEEYYSNNYNKMYALAKVDTSKSISKQYLYIHDSLYKSIYDSFARVFRKEVSKKIRESVVPDEIVLSVAICKIKEALPIIKNELLTSNHYFNKNVAELALAGLGDTFYVKKNLQKHYNIVEKYKANFTNKSLAVALEFQNSYDVDFTAMYLIGTQESIFLLHEWLDTASVYNTSYDGSEIYEYTAGHFVSKIHWLLQNKNFHDGFNNLTKHPYYSIYEGFATKEQIIYTKEWLIKNKGKYEF